MPKQYNKLVRDKIPEIISKNGKVPNTKVLEAKEYIKALYLKLHEELREFISANEREEVLAEAADVLEVVRAILRTRAVLPEDVEEIRLKKLAERGGFEERIFLVSVSSPKK